MQGQNDNHPQLWNAGPVKIMARSNRARRLRAQCREPGCTLPVRAVQGAGYCEAHAVAIDYQLQRARPGQGRGAPVSRTCSCGRTFTHRKAVRTPSAEAWAEFCPSCHSESPIKLTRIRAHNVPADLVRAWLSKGSKLPCDICGKTLARRNRGSSPIIDHDHSCCPGGLSRGDCIRGVLCVDCNTKIGHVEGIYRAGLWDEIDRYLRNTCK